MSESSENNDETISFDGKSTSGKGSDETISFDGQSTSGKGSDETIASDGQSTSGRGNITPVPAVSISEGPGSILGPYKLLEQLGEGSFGVVFMAEQSQPIKRRVALKIIKAGMDTKEVIARFEAERQALALMDHPNIAKVIDAGTTETGRPYFAMELVKGVPVTEYCNLHRLDTRRRLELFLDICSAVQHAHQKGIIHRDLKPSNILVSLPDGKPAVKVIDFGIAKAVSQELTEKTLFTAHGQMIGTPNYMSPEQAEGGGHGVDTRSDVYSLGVVLYELITGRTPFDPRKLRGVGFEEILRLIREEEPPKPSTRLGKLEDNEMTVIAEAHQAHPEKLTRMVRGDLDWIAMKALEKDRERRYETANAFGDDIRRYLNNETVSARSPSTVYRMHKYVRRNRVALTVTAIVAASLVTGSVVSVIMAVRATHEADRATQEADRATKAEELAEEKSVIAQQKEKEATQAKIALEKKNDDLVLKEKEAREAKEDADEARELAVASEKVAIQARKVAEEERREAEKAAAEAKAVLNFLNEKVLAAARPREQEGGLGIDATIRAAIDAAEPQIGRAFTDQPGVEATIRHTMGTSYWYLGEPKIAIPQLQQALDLRTRELGPDDPQTLKSMTILANSFQHAQLQEEALALREETLKRMKKTLGAEHADTLTSANNLAISYRLTGRFQEALALDEETLKLRKKELGPEHEDTLASMGSLASSYGYAGRHEEALKLREEVLDRFKKSLGPVHPDTLNSMHNLANSYELANRHQEALSLREETLRVRKEVQGHEHPDTLRSMSALASSYRTAGRVDEALDLSEKTLDLSIKVLGKDHQETMSAMNSLAYSYRATGKREESAKQYRDLLAVWEKQAVHDWRFFYTKSTLGEILTELKKYADAEPLLLEGHRGLKDALPDDNQGRIEYAINCLVGLYSNWGKTDKASSWKKVLESGNEGDKSEN